MRLGANVFGYEPNAKSYVEKICEKNYKAAYCPDYLVSSSQEQEIEELVHQLKENDIVLSEVGVWCNPLSPIPEVAEKGKAYVEDRLRLADRLGARCCVNIMGAKSAATWYAPDPKNFTEEFRKECIDFYGIVLDKVQPKNTKLAFEVMPFCFLDCTEEYLRLMEDMKREGVAVHLDLINMLNSPRTLYDYRRIFKEAVDVLGKWCVSAHLKDIMLDPNPCNTKMDEVLIGTGVVDMGYMLQCLSEVPNDLPIMLEHLSDEASYDAAAKHVLKAAAEAGVEVKGGIYADTESSNYRI